MSYGFYLADMLKEIVQDKHAAKVIQYGWSGDEELPDTVAIYLFHAVFAAFHILFHDKQPELIPQTSNWEIIPKSPLMYQLQTI